MDSNHAPQVNQRAEAAERDSVGLKSREPDNSASGGRLLMHSVDLMLSQVVGFFGLVDLPFPLSLRHHPPFSGSTNLPSSAPIVRNLVKSPILISKFRKERQSYRQQKTVTFVGLPSVIAREPKVNKGLDHQVAAAGKAKASTHP
ncbi:hypothetical protein PCANC_13015 [Puccinia coronata f. sp. avenae]|uniref:Uncharacterized protein n=1 Tax=Puccinia coronata f. sp. avenae TaxID=200324 RepID=A0A2N5US96_9BASI|nr:hypothetical protein PCANC_12509 [Puccinia coronata f. sp. avenae]PLW40604.1 hypothetical protein PCANC_13015 [Puccinia coronata f. sp. avenae]